MMPEQPELRVRSSLENQFAIGLRHGQTEMEVAVGSEAAELMLDALTTMGEYYADQLDSPDVQTDSRRVFECTRKIHTAGLLAARLRGRQPYEESPDLRNLREGTIGRTALVDEFTPSIDDAKRQPPRTDRAILHDAQVDFVLDALTEAPDVLVAKAYEMNTSGPPEVPHYPDDTPDTLERRQLATAQVRKGWNAQIAELHNRAQQMNSLLEIVGSAGLPENPEAPPA
jgi:hypothetical protein